MDKKRLKIAVQKSGRLSDDSVKLLKDCGLKINLHGGKLTAHAANMPVDLLRVRDDDIPGLIFDGVVDLGIVGQNVLEEIALAYNGSNNLEEQTQYKLLEDLPFGGCRLSIALPKEIAYEGPQSLSGMRIATSYPYLLKRYMDSHKLDYKSSLLTGSVEIAPRAGIADAICDLVSSGGTLEANGLREVEVIYRSTACLIQSVGTITEEKQALIDKLLARIEGVTQAIESKYIMLHAPKERLDDIITLLPGAEAPTLLPLSGDDTKVALHMVSHENLFWETMEALKQKGASSILVLPIEKMMR